MLPRVAAWANAVPDAHAIVMATLALSRREVLCARMAVAWRRPVRPVALEIAANDDMEIFVRPLGDVEFGQNHAHEKEE